MAVYMIRGEQVTAHAAALAKAPKGALIIRAADEIGASDLPSSQLVALWNALPDSKPITKFKDRKTASRRLWVAFQRLTPTLVMNSRRPKKGRATTKQDRVIAMLRQPEGATIDDLVGITDWQRHTVRGMIAGALKKKLCLCVVSDKAERGRVYRVTGTATKRAD